MKKFFLFLCLGLWLTASWAQNCQATAKLDSTHILIGDYLKVNLTVTAPAQLPVVIPQLKENMLDSIEWIGNSPIDTIKEGTQNTYRQSIIITAFDSGTFVFPAIPILSADSMVLAQTQPLTFEVATVAVDTTAAIRDIKQPVRVLITFREILPYILMGLAIAAIVALLVFLFVKYGRKKHVKKVVGKPKPKIKPHILALNALEELRIKKLWQEGKVKPYYSELTDIVREYIDNRWEIDAPEMTSSEILNEIDGLKLSQELVEKLRFVLSTADLVKFAKWEPLPNDHDTCMKNAVTFVKETAEMIEQTEESKK